MPPAPHGGCRRQDRTGPKIVSLSGSSGLPYRRAAETALLGRQHTWGREEAPSTVPPAGLPAAPPAPPRRGRGGLCRLTGRTAPSCSGRRSSTSGTGLKIFCGNATFGLPMSVSKLLRIPSGWGGGWREESLFKSKTSHSTPLAGSTAPVRGTGHLPQRRTGGTGDSTKNHDPAGRCLSTRGKDIGMEVELKAI